MLTTLVEKIQSKGLTKPFLLIMKKLAWFNFLVLFPLISDKDGMSATKQHCLW